MLVTGKKTFAAASTLEFDAANLDVVNGDPIELMLHAKAGKLVFEEPVVMNGTNFGSHLLLGEGKPFGKFDLSEHAVPLYESMLVRSDISGTTLYAIFCQIAISSWSSVKQIIQHMIYIM
jgi:hypothetical protein